KMFGANPWSIAVPSGRHGAVVLDIANTGVARGKVYAAKERGQRLPEGWAIKAMRRIAEALPRDGDPWCLPTADEAVAVSRSQASLARDAGVRTPAADFLDTFSSEEATREPHGRDTPKPGETSSSSNPERLDRYAALASKAWPPP
ncbi:MAG TPA: Ldh family oxidoreductase, partial [Thermoanaerobaculaceae bacterium]|nr:Ldh family oxidoreductase [Thermoanaerobaculaceae bacterium]